MGNNGNRYSLTVKKQALLLRRRGFSYNEIISQFGISKGTACVWLRDIKMSARAKGRLKEISVRGRIAGRETVRRRRELEQENSTKEAEAVISTFDRLDSVLFLKILTAIIFWCEGGKRDIGKGVTLINSDPLLIRVFLFALRKGFEIDENKFRVILHLHEYHNISKSQKFWSDVSGIPLSQFRGPYIKPHTGIRRREGYAGCASIRYGDSRLAKKIDALYHTFGQKLVGAW